MIRRYLYHRRPGMSKPVVIVCLATVALLGAVAIWWVNRDSSTPKKQPISAEQARQLVRLAEEANACLENEDFREGFELAEERLKQLEEKLPDSALVHRNRVIARLLFFRKNKDEFQDDQDFIDATTALVEKLIEKEANAFEPYILAVRWRYELNNDITEADVELLESAIANAGSSPIPYYEFYDKTSILDDKDISGIVAKKQMNLAKAYELQPDNLKLAMLYLQQLAELKSEKFAETWDQFIENLSPLVVSADLEQFDTAQQEYVAKINEATKAQDWAQTLLGVRRLSNLVKRGEVQKIDLARVQPYELEFLKTELESDIVARAASEKSAAKPVPAKFGSTAAIQAVNPVKALRILDFDLDNALEIVTLSDTQLTVYEQSDGGKWNLSFRFPLDKKYAGFLAADLDYDKRTFAAPKSENSPKGQNFSSNYSDPDFVLYGPSGVDVFENKLNANGSRSLEKIQPGDLASVSAVSMATLVDIDHDKDLDLIVASDAGFKMFLSRGIYRFTISRNTRCFHQATGKLSRWTSSILIGTLISMSWSDSRVVLLVTLKTSVIVNFASGLSMNQSKLLRMVANALPSKSMANHRGTSFAVRRMASSSHRRKRRSLRSGRFSRTRLGNTTGSILAIADFNNDGSLDSLCTNNEGDGDQEAKIVLGDGVSISNVACSIEKKITIADAADLDGDGKVDLVGVSGDGKFIDVWSNVTETDNQWIAISVCGRDSNFPKGRINNHAIGSFVELKAGDHYFATTVKRPQLHFGLGQNKNIDLIRFLWTSGMPQSLFKIKSGQSVYEEMFEKGSCPYIYTWDGEKFTFFSDCLWAAPLGLQFAPGKFIPCRNWEYLKIPGEMLRPKDGQYVLQITEELREAAYFDLVKLYAIDHPEDVEIFTNEKVGPPFIAEHKIHTVREARSPVAARDMGGKDVLNLITKKDGKYYRGFEKRIGKGLAPLHYIELDFGDLKDEFTSASSDAKLTLFLNGWIRPTIVHSIFRMPRIRMNKSSNASCAGS